MPDNPTNMTIYDKRRDCIERWHLGDPAAANDMAAEVERLRAEVKRLEEDVVFARRATGRTL